MFGFQWHLTDRCNRRCRHCYQSGHDQSSFEASAAERIKMADIILGALPNEPVTVNLTGGEPLLVPDLIDLMRHLESHANLSEINIITNGTIVNEMLLKQLAGFEHLRSFRISLESGDQAINDTIRGSGSLAGLRKTVPVYKALTGRHITIMVTLSKMNFPAIPQTVAFSREIGADSILFERFVPIGSGLGMSESVLSADDWFNCIKLIGEAAQIDIDPYDLAACRGFGILLDPSVEADERLEAALCNLGPDSMALMPDGTVFPCRRLQIQTGNILKMPFAEIRRRLATWECSQVRTRLRGMICGVCPYDDCPGCRAMAQAVCGDPLADDPQCVLNRQDL